MIRRVLIGVLALVLLAGCGGDNPAPDSDPPILSGFDAMPKELATVDLTATPTQVIVGVETVSVAPTTPTPGPPPPTATLTPYVGIFLGQPTAEDGETEPETIPTLAPYMVNPGVSAPSLSGPGIATPGSGNCGFPVAATFANAYSTVQQRLGCPISGGATASLVTQPFEHGHMFWRDTRQIYVIANSGQFWQVADGWQEGMPADDPAFAPPGGLLQPVRGFGLVWRSNQPVRDALGWAMLPEAQYGGFWQDFERGAMFVGNNNLIYAVFPAEGQHSGPLSP